MRAHPEEFLVGDIVVPGFRFASTAAGIKKREGVLDLALLACDRPAAAAAVFTQNRVKAAPVVLSAERISRGACQAIVVNSGNANACTGAAGMRDARETAAAAAQALGIDEKLICVASTGVIGEKLPIERVRSAIPALASALGPGGFDDFARAILTTDKGPKWAAARRTLGRKQVTLVGATKGAGMIAPNMATTLTFLATDAACDRVYLRNLL